MDLVASAVALLLEGGARQVTSGRARTQQEDPPNKERKDGTVHEIRVGPAQECRMRYGASSLPSEIGEVSPPRQDECDVEDEPGQRREEQDPVDAPA